MPRIAGSRRRHGGHVLFTIRRRGRVLCPLFVLLVLGVLVFLRYYGDEDSTNRRESSQYADAFSTQISGEPEGKSHSTTNAAHGADADRKGDSGLEALLPNHTWGKDGLLVVNPDGEHPIYELIRRAEAKWADKQRRTSKTLEQAVKEYERRYSRPPPLGFDHWWNYVVKYNVQLPDEYDQIYMDLEPYWGIDPAELSVAEIEHEKHRDSFTIGKSTRDDVLSVLNIALPPAKVQDVLTRLAKPQIELMEEVHGHIPPFRAVLSPEDGPSFLADWTWRSAALEAARMGKFLQREDIPPLNITGFAAACPPHSPLRDNLPLPNAQLSQSPNKTFIFDHRRAMDPCLHPAHLLLHSEFLKLDIDPIPQRFPAPTLSRSTTSLHADIHIVSAGDGDESDFADRDPRWEEKSEDRLFWRGKPSGMWASRWRETQRARLVDVTRNTSRYDIEADDGESQAQPESESETINILPPLRQHSPIGGGRSWNRLTVNNASMDIGFTIDEFDDCVEELCELVDVVFGAKERLSLEDMGEYKYLVDVDGDGRSDQFRKVMSMNSLIFKATLYPEWYLDRIQPWVHYVPIQLDYSDLYDALTFFSGDVWGDGEHDDLARKIALAGREWVSTFWRREDMVAYMFRLWLEYARVMSADREIMDFKLPR